MTVPDQVIRSLEARVGKDLVSELLAAHTEAKQSLYLGGLRLNGVEGGRFCEASYRMLQRWAGMNVTPLGRRLDTDGLTKELSELPFGSQPDSIRLHIPRALRVVYDIRNKRDLAHLGDGIDPNLQDATLVSAALDWVLAEWIRLSNPLSPNEAQAVVDSVVERRAPTVQDFGGFLKVLNPRLRAADFVLVLLYQCGRRGAELSDLKSWSKPSMLSHLQRTLDQLVNDKAFVHRVGPHFEITQSGILEVERRHLLDL